MLYLDAVGMEEEKKTQQPQRAGTTDSFIVTYASACQGGVLGWYAVLYWTGSHQGERGEGGRCYCSGRYTPPFIACVTWHVMNECRRFSLPTRTVCVRSE